MVEITAREVQGSVKSYKPDGGWGFIEHGDAKTEFFHISNLLCSPPYEGEAVVFDIAKSSSPEHEHEAVNVRRVACQLCTGDILEWEVEPGTWRTRGVIAAHDSGERLSFSSRDFRQDKSQGNPKPRPWHAASFGVVQVSGRRVAVDIELDTRYPLYRFAYLGTEEDMIHDLKVLCLPENWEYRHSAATKASPILHNYLHFTFARLWDEDRGVPDIQKKVRVRRDLQPPLAAFNTGLVDRKYKSIYALFDANEPGRQQKWRFRAFCIPGEGHGKVLASYFNPLPGPAAYFGSTVELLYDPNAPLHPDYTHILGQNRERLPKEILDQVARMDSTFAMRTLTMHLDEAIGVAKKRCSWNYRTAVPHYFPSFKRLEFLLPLCLVRDNRVDVALSVQKTDTGYLGHTILTLDWAYKSARLVCRPDSDWLTPEHIDETSEESDMGDLS